MPGREPDDAPPLHEPLSPARVALRNLEAARREALRDMALRQAPATAEQVAEVRYRHEVAAAYYRENALEPGGWAAVGLVEPRPWELIEAELLVPPLTGSPPPSVPPPKPRPGRKSKWKRVQLESITKRLANGDGPVAIGLDLGMRHQRISELRSREDTYWDVEQKRLVTPPGTVFEGGYVVLPPRTR